MRVHGSLWANNHPIASNQYLPGTVQLVGLPGSGKSLLAEEYAARFEADPQRRAQYLGPNWDVAKVRGTPYNTGEGLQLALDAGAQPYGNWSGCHAIQWDAAAPTFGVEIGKPISVIRRRCNDQNDRSRMRRALRPSIR